MQIRLVWKELVALAWLAGLASGAIAIAATLLIDDGRTQGAVGIGGLILVISLSAGLGGRRIRRLHDDRRALDAR